MATQVQFRRGTAAENNAFTGALAEVTVNTTDSTLRVHDGVTAGGFTIVGLTATQTLTNKTLTSAVLTSPNIGVATGTSFSATGAINTATTVSATGNITGGNVLTGGLISATANVTGGNVLTGGLISAAGNITGANILTGGLISAAGNITGANILTGGLISAAGNITGANLIINGTAGLGSAVLILSGNIQTTAANNTANIGNATNYFNTVHAKATTAQYADVAELYTADAPYGEGTVLIFGGEQEVTINTSSHSSAVAGVVSANPSHLMNAGLKSTHVVAVALLGRLHCNVRGPISKGDLLVTSDMPGVAEKLDTTKYQPGCVIGKSLENYVSDKVARIEIAVGVK
jgi:hypothetical protein